MRITCTADLHGNFPELSGGDLLIIAGDITGNDSVKAWIAFFDWLRAQKYRKKIYIGGNHDNFLTQCCTNEEARSLPVPIEDGFEYLCDNGTEFEGLKIWGSPWTKTFPNMNPRCKAFTVDTEKELFEKWSLIPEDTDILITHSPPYGMFDEVKCSYTGHYKHVGSTSLISKWADLEAKIHIFGHIHEDYGVISDHDGHRLVYYINASHVNELYEPVNKPIDIEI